MVRVPAVELAPGVVRIPTIGAASINSYALVDDDGSASPWSTAGSSRAPARIVAGLRAIGRHPGDVRRIVLTHAHTDHAGGAAEMAARTGAPVAVHEADARRRGGPASALRPVAAGRPAVLSRLPGGGFPPVRVDERLTDGQVLDGGAADRRDPGHTPGASVCCTSRAAR